MKQETCLVGKYALIAIGFVLIIWLGLFIKSLIDESGYERAKLFNTAIQADSTESFNYSVDSKQGNVLTSGTFTVKESVEHEDIVGEYSLIQITQEEYTRHTRTYQCGTEESPRTCTETYYTWDYDNGENKQSDTLILHDREYPSQLFALTTTNRLGCESIKENCKSGYRYERIGWFTSEGDLRWSYAVRPTTFWATILVDTQNGILEPINDNQVKLMQGSIKDEVIKANKVIAGTIFIWIWFILSIIGALFIIKNQ